MRIVRPLSNGEIALSQSVFGTAIDYDRVRIIRGRWWPFQPKGVVMAPTGNIHFHPADPRWSDDFAGESLSLQGLFIHEMTHVWQSQKRGKYYLPLMRHPFCHYGYQLQPGRRFDLYGLEQQAEIVRHRFLADRGVTVPQRCEPGLLPFAPIVTLKGHSRD